MWLSADERRLLEGYAAKIERPGIARQFRVRALTQFIKTARPSKIAAKVRQYGESNMEESQSSLEEMKRKISEYIDERARIEVAHLLLTERALLSVVQHESELDVVGVTLTVAGYDQGRKYARWLSRSGEWFEEYRNHWLFLIAAFFGGVWSAAG